MRWDINPTLVELGWLELRWYGLFFASGLLLAARAMPRIFVRRGLPEEHAHRLTLWIAVGIIVGAHLIHLIFYEPHSFIHNPRRIIEIGKGLSSHGGGLGTVVAIALFVRRHKAQFHRYLDACMIAGLWIFPCVRVGNFFNSEIYGRPTDLPWGVIFARYHAEPRHPVQLYEALFTAGLLAAAYALDRRYRDRWRDGALFYVLMGSYFTGRFFAEYVKAYQILDNAFPLTMGQLLSLPPAMLAAGMLLFSKEHNLRSPRPATAGPPASETPTAGPARPLRKNRRKPKKKR